MKIKEEDLVWADKLEIDGEHVRWLYYNQDGNNSFGQIVEMIIYPWNVLKSALDEDAFWEHLYNVCATYLHDNGSKCFKCYAHELLKPVQDFNLCRDNTGFDTMQWLIDWATENN